MKKPKIFDEWFDMVYPVNEWGEYETSEIWSEKERDECYDFLEELLKVESLDEVCGEEEE